jgi:hypothetical protein
MTSQLSTAIMRDVFANRPAASLLTIGRLFFAYDTGVTYRDNGATWDVWGVLPGTTALAGAVQFATNAQNAASRAVQGNDARFNPWVKLGAGVLVAAYGNGDPGAAANIVTAATSPNAVSTSVARCVQFRLPFAFNPAHFYVFGRATLVGGYGFAIYPVGSSTSKTWDSGAVDFTNATWSDVTAGSLSSVNLTANTDYWLCVTGLISSATAALEIAAMGSAVRSGADAAPWGAGLGIGMPIQASFTVSGGVFPGTLPASAAATGGTIYGPLAWMSGTSS